MIIGHHLAERFRGTWDRLTSTRSAVVVTSVILGNLVLIIFTNRVTLQDYPSVSDEYVYQLMAQMFAEGKVSVPSPEPPEFFKFLHVINDGRYYGKYSPGWPLVLSVGYLLGVPWLVNPVLALITLILLYHIASRHFSIRVANICLFLVFANPFILFYSAGYYSHPSCLLFLTLFLWFYLEALDDLTVTRNYVYMGVWAGMAFLVRPYTVVAALLPLSIYLIYTVVKSGHPRGVLGKLGIGAGVYTLFFACFLYYNYLLTGDPLLQPFTKYGPSDHPSLSLTLEELQRTLTRNLGWRLLEMNTWVPLSIFFVFMYLFLRDTRANVKGVLMILVFASMMLAYLFYWFHGLNLHGPRYVYEAAAGLILVSGVVLSHLPRAGLMMLVVVMLLNIFTFAAHTEEQTRFVGKSKEVYDVVEREGLSNAIVFLRAGSGPHWYPMHYTRNGIHFGGSVLYVLDLGRNNVKLLEEYPGRNAYYWEYDQAVQSGRLTPYRAPN